MSWLTEDSTVVLVLAGLVAAALIVVLMKTGRAAILLMLLGVALVAGLCVLVEMLVVTERERVEFTVFGVAAALQANDMQSVEGYIAPRAAELRQRAKWVLDRVEIQEARITDGPTITINSLTSPLTATAEFMAVARGKLKSGTQMHDRYVSRFLVTLSWQNDQWLIEEVEQETPFGD